MNAVNPAAVLGLQDAVADPSVRAGVEEIGRQIEALREQHASLARAAGILSEHDQTRTSIFHGYLWVMVVAFIVTLCVTPIMRRLAVAHGVIDRPKDPRKIHRQPVAYLGGAAVFLGLMAGILYSILACGIDGLITFHPTRFLTENGYPFFVRPSILIGMTVIAVVGLLDDVMGISPRVKIGGMLFAAAALAIDDVGVNVAQGVMAPIGRLFGNASMTYFIELPFTVPILDFSRIEIDLIYWAGTAIIALFILGACNASNLIDGLDGLLSGVTCIANMGLLIIALGLALADDGPRDAQRIVLCMAVAGACLGFLPHNFNPATIFLGDCGSLLLGYCTIVNVLLLGDMGKTPLVLAGLVIYAIPIIDTVLAIVRRKLAGRSISSADSDHLHHMLKRALGVNGAVFTLYGIGAVFATIGVLMTLGRGRSTYALALIFAAFIAVIAIKIARKKQIEDQAMHYDAKRAAALPAPTSPAGADPGRAGAGAGAT